MVVGDGVVARRLLLSVPKRAQLWSLTEARDLEESWRLFDVAVLDPHHSIQWMQAIDVDSC